MEIRRATVADIGDIQAMAEVVFRTTYARILSAEQLDYMMDWMYSTESLAEQITAQGKDFFIAIDGAEGIGYVSIEEEDIMADGRQLAHLQKIYVMPRKQATGVGRALFTFIRELLEERYPAGCRMELNVNRENPAVRFYERMGMRRDRQGDFPIGNGYCMNDYIYALDLNV